MTLFTADGFLNIEDGRGYSVAFNPNKANGLSHPYHLDESIFIFRGISRNFSFLFHFSMNIMSANRIAPDGTLFCGVTSGAILFAYVP